MDKVAYVLSCMTGETQNWVMQIFQAPDEGLRHNLLDDYDAF